MSDHVKVFFLLPVLVILTACRMNTPPVATVSDIASTSEVSIQFSTPTATLASNTPTITPIPATPTSTPLPPTTIPTTAPAALNPNGPYVAIFSTSNVWITNPDGSFPTQLSDTGMVTGLDEHSLVSPTGDRLALVVSNEEGLDLVMIKIPSGEQKTVAHLIDALPAGYYDHTSALAFATYAIRDYASLAWQPPDGRLLAFTGAMDGPTADLYLYDTVTGEITRLTDGSSQAVMPVWSPDGEYILHYGVRWVPPFGGAIGSANQMDGLWAVKVSDGEVITLPKGEGSIPHFVGWLDDTHYITYDPGECYSERLRSIDFLTGEETVLMDNSFWYFIDQSPENGALMFSGKEECESSPGEGVFLMLPGQAEPTRVSDVRAWEIRWMPESRVFHAYPEALFSADGATRYDPPVYNSSFNPAISLLGYQAWNVIQNQTGRVVVKVPGMGWRTILEGSIDELVWDPLVGNTLLIILADGGLYAATYPEFVPRRMGDLGGGFNQAIWIDSIAAATPEG